MGVRDRGQAVAEPQQRFKLLRSRPLRSPVLGAQPRHGRGIDARGARERGVSGAADFFAAAGSGGAASLSLSSPNGMVHFGLYPATAQPQIYIVTRVPPFYISQLSQHDRKQVVAFRGDVWASEVARLQDE